MPLQSVTYFLCVLFPHLDIYIHVDSVDPTHTFVHSWMHTHIIIVVCHKAHTHAQTHKHTHIHSHTHTHTHTHTHSLTHIHTHTHTHPTTTTKQKTTYEQEARMGLLVLLALERVEVSVMAKSVLCGTGSTWPAVCCSGSLWIKMI